MQLRIVRIELKGVDSQVVEVPYGSIVLNVNDFYGQPVVNVITPVGNLESESHIIRMAPANTTISGEFATFKYLGSTPVPTNAGYNHYFEQEAPQAK